MRGITNPREKRKTQLTKRAQKTHWERERKNTNKEREQKNWRREKFPLTNREKKPTDKRKNNNL